MSYVESNLMSGEKIIYKACISWFIFLPGIIFTALGILLIAADKQGEGGAAIGYSLLIFAVISLLKAFIIKISTEFAVTSKRVIAKSGFIRRYSVELNHSKVESFIVDQSIFGRMFNYGAIIVRGIGGGGVRTPIQGIHSPLDFRKNAMETIDQSEQMGPVQGPAPERTDGRYYPPLKSGHPVYMLIAFSGPLQDRQFIVDKEMFYIGASRKNDLVIADDHYVSRNHACLRYEKGSLWLADQQSRNGTFLNGKRLKDTPLIVNVSDRIQMGKSTFEVTRAPGR